MFYGMFTRTIRPTKCFNDPLQYELNDIGTSKHVYKVFGTIITVMHGLQATLAYLFHKNSTIISSLIRD